MARVIGIGGVFLKARDPQTLGEWYRQRLGFPLEDGGCATFGWRFDGDPDRAGHTVWSLFPSDTDYFSPGSGSAMVNYIVDDLDGMLETLRAAGAEVDGNIQEESYGRFGWAVDPEGNRIELWEPPAADSRS